MKKSRHPLGPRHLFAVVLCVLLWFHKDVLTEDVPPGDRLDAMGVYNVSNILQCQRLCWYRPLCTSYSYLCTQGNKAVNCVLHSSYVEDADTVNRTSLEWREQIALPPFSGQTHSCSGPKPCGPEELCVPQFNGDFRCAPLPAKCGNPDPIVNGSLVALSGLQGEVTTVQCVSEFVQSPRYVAMNITCQVNSRWTSFKGECLQAAYHGPAVPFLGRMPWSLDDGWMVCVKGVLNSHQKMTVNFMAGSETDADTLAHVDFRIDWGNDLRLVLVATQLDGQWGNRQKLTDPPLPLVKGDEFQLTFHKAGDTLNITLLQNRENVTNFIADVSTASVINILKPILYLEIKSGATLSYVNLADGC